MCFGQYSVKVDENDPNKKSHENPIKLDPKNLYSPKELLICFIWFIVIQQTIHNIK